MAKGKIVSRSVNFGACVVRQMVVLGVLSTRRGGCAVYLRQW